MTIEEKVREVALNLWRDSQGTSMYPNKEGNKQINQATQAILARIKPLSKERLVDIIVDFMRINKDPDKGFTGELKSVGWSDINNLAEVILAEWGKE